MIIYSIVQDKGFLMSVVKQVYSAWQKRQESDIAMSSQRFNAHAYLAFILAERMWIKCDK